MKNMNKTHHHRSDSRLVLAFMLLCLTGIAGISSWPRSESAVGYFTVSANPFGVAIYQEGPHASVQFVGARSFTVKRNTITIPGASKLMYSRDDIIFDDTSIYTEPPQEQVDYLQKKKVTTTDLGRTVYLVNPHIPGVLELRGSNMILDRDQKQITGSVQAVIVHDTL